MSHDYRDDCLEEEEERSENSGAHQYATIQREALSSGCKNVLVLISEPKNALSESKSAKRKNIIISNSDLHTKRVDPTKPFSFCKRFQKLASR